MTKDDAEEFLDVLTGVYALFGKTLTKEVGKIWFEALKFFDLDAIVGAFGRHTLNPDGGKFLPRPADIVAMIEGGTEDAALQAWTKVDKAVRSVGPYRSVVFDDALIHAVLVDIGGWCAVCGKSDADWPFVQREFVARYRAHRQRHTYPDYLPVMIGHAEAQNGRLGFITAEPPTLIGDKAKARIVLAGGAKQIESAPTQKASSVLRIIGAAA